jgi:hypothetical protein
MDRLVIEGLRPYDGKYELAPTDHWTTREWIWIREISGYLPLTLDEGLAGGDPSVFAAFAVIVLVRAGKLTPNEVDDFHARILDAPFGPTVRLELGEREPEEDDAGPPESSGVSSNASGGLSNGNSESSRAIPPPSGIPASATSASRRERSAT